MNKLDILFSRKKLNPEKLLSFGFLEKNENFAYTTTIADGQLQMVVLIAADGVVNAKVIDISSDEEYVLHRTSEASGSFVGTVRADYENVLRDVADKCFEPNVFKSECAKNIMRYVRDIYHDELEFLWPRSPKNAIFRRKDTDKWYGALLVLSKRKLGIDSDEVIYILNLKIKTDDIESVVDGNKYYPFREYIRRSAPRGRSYAIATIILNL